ncbi:MAG: type II toxin-antitoxin system VapC family toxin [Longimicrobiales bacterium]
MIVLDTSVLVETLGAGGGLRDELRSVFDAGQRVVLPTLVLYEWLRGPRIPEELTAQEALLPRDEAIPFGPAEAALAAQLYLEVPRPHGREVDLAIAACALSWNGRLWTLNRTDFADVPGLALR